MPPFLILHGHSDEIVRNDSLLSPARFLLRLFAQLDKRIFKVAYYNSKKKTAFLSGISFQFWPFVFRYGSQCG